MEQVHIGFDKEDHLLLTENLDPERAKLQRSPSSGTRRGRYRAVCLQRRHCHGPRRKAKRFVNLVGLDDEEDVT